MRKFLILSMVTVVVMFGISTSSNAAFIAGSSGGGGSYGYGSIESLRQDIANASPEEIATEAAWNKWNRAYSNLVDDKVDKEDRPEGATTPYTFSVEDTYKTETEESDEEGAKATTKSGKYIVERDARGRIIKTTWKSVTVTNENGTHNGGDIITCSAYIGGTNIRRATMSVTKGSDNPGENGVTISANLNFKNNGLPEDQLILSKTTGKKGWQYEIRRGCQYDDNGDYSGSTRTTGSDQSHNLRSQLGDLANEVNIDDLISILTANNPEEIFWTYFGGPSS